MTAYSHLLIRESDVGKRSGTIEAIGPSFLVRCDNGKRRRYVVARCDCGTLFVIDWSVILRPAPRCVYCARKAPRTARGLAGTPEHTVWRKMCERCHKPYAKSFEEYGGRGIKVCDEWRGRKGFARFIDHIGPKPSPSHQIDRIDNDGDYEPGNVRWATPTQNARNRRSNWRLKYRGKPMLLVELAEMSGVSAGVIRRRIRRGFSVEDAVETPVSENRRCVPLSQR